MSRKAPVEIFQTKVTRNDRFAQMSHQEKVIEQKKKEIQARLEQKQKVNLGTSTSSDSKTTNVTSSSKQNKSSIKLDLKNYNQFSNDGSFLDQFKQLKDKKIDQKLKSFRSGQDRSYNEERINKSSRWSHRRRSPSPKSKLKISRFSDKHLNNEPKINISTTYSTLISHANFNVQPPICIGTQNVIGQPLLKNDMPPAGIAYSAPCQTTTSVIAAPPVMLTVPPPQVLQQPISGSLIAPPPVLTTTTILTPVTNAPTNLPPPNIITSLIPPPVSAVAVQNALGISTTSSVSLPNAVGLISTVTPALELASIPPPNPIQIQNIPQPKPINTHNIPSPAPLQVQNIPPPSPIQLNEIPNPKPLDVINIPTPNDGCVEKAMSDPDFIKSIPPPNKSIPPPSLQDTTINVNIAVPPPNTIHPTSLPPPQNVVASQNLLSTQNIVVHSIPPPQILPTQGIQTLPPVQNITLVSQVQTTTVQNLPPSLAPPPPPPQATISVALSVPNPTNVGIITSTSTPNVIPSLLAQPVLPPPGMNVTTLPVNIHCPPPVVLTSTTGPSLSALPPSFINQPPPITTQLPPINIPPPTTASIGASAVALQTFKDMNSVCPPGTSEYEAMASLGRIVAQCGPGIEDVVCQRKRQDPNLWFLFYKDSVAYRQYLQLVEQFKAEMGKTDVKQENYEPEDTYETEAITKDDFERKNLKQEEIISYQFMTIKPEIHLGNTNSMLEAEDDPSRRKRKSRWGEKDSSVPPPTVIMTNSPSLLVNSQTPLIESSNSIMLSKITRNDPGLIHYILNTYGTMDLTEEELKKAEDNFKINLVYQDMLRKREEISNLAKSGKNKYEYDSDEETDGGTWEHKLRIKEMSATQYWATELTKNAEGKHHIGDFLPPEELKRFMEKSMAIKEGRQPEFSDYKDFKLTDDNVGFKMLQKLGWTEGQGLGANASGIVEPVNKTSIRDQNQGLGLTNPGSVENNDDEYDAYRKRMMLAYRFRPNPLNNPRRPYY